MESLIVDLVRFVAERDRNYDEIMDAWRTSCPKLPVWEEANERGLITTDASNGSLTVRVTPLGREFLIQHP